MPRIAANKPNPVQTHVDYLQSKLPLSGWHIESKVDLELMWDPVVQALGAMKKCRAVTELPCKGDVEWHQIAMTADEKKRIAGVVEDILRVEESVLPSHYGECSLNPRNVQLLIVSDFFAAKDKKKFYPSFVYSLFAVEQADCRSVRLVKIIHPFQNVPIPSL